MQELSNIIVVNSSMADSGSILGKMGWAKEE